MSYEAGGGDWNYGGSWGGETGTGGYGEAGFFGGGGYGTGLDYGFDTGSSSMAAGLASFGLSPDMIAIIAGDHAAKSGYQSGNTGLDYGIDQSTTAADLGDLSIGDYGAEYGQNLGNIGQDVSTMSGVLGESVETSVPFQGLQDLHNLNVSGKAKEMGKKRY